MQRSAILKFTVLLTVYALYENTYDFTVGDSAWKSDLPVNS
jgi:hypothetical protein